MAVFRRAVERMLQPSGIALDGTEPWDITVHDDRLYRRVLTQGTLGVGESYMDGWWDCEQIDEMVARAQRGGVASRLGSPLGYARAAASRLRNPQTRRRSREVGRRHYDVGNDLYARMLGTRMIYSCAYWRDVTDLDAAQEAKLMLIANKLQLEQGMRLLDVGCGWGGAARFFAETAGCEVVGVTISRRQAELAREHCTGFPVEIRLQDYRDVEGRYDRVYSIGMFEHVGVRNHRAFMDVVRAALADADGLALLHTIGSGRSQHTADPWIERYVFPNSMLPSAAQITAAAEGRLVLEDWQNFGADYDRTLMAWHRNIEAAWDDLPGYDERFRRMWRFYLLSCAGAFRARVIHLWQIVFSRDGRAEAYRPPGIR